MVAGISVECGLEGFLLFEHSVNSNRFLQVIDKFERSKGNYSLVGDNASWHKSKECMAEYKRRRIFFVFNVPYSPQLNPIENYFGILKTHYKRLRMQSAADDIERD